ncbi:MAG: hypothetical protein OXC07_07525 [Kistimonas sp.]|nr:hypothetical protein [Kistimonas sp.]
MSNTGISGVGSATEKSFAPQEQKSFGADGQQPDSQDADSFSSQLEQGIRSEKETNVEGSPIVLKENPGNLGDKILNGFQGLKDNIDGRHQKVDQMLGSEEILSMKDMFQTQRAMTNLMMTQDLIGKVVGKATQTVETMMKQQ